jgi:ornithine cyclodeaminase
MGHVAGDPRKRHDFVVAVVVLNESELRACIGIDRDALHAVSESFGWLHDGRAMVPPVVHIDATDQSGEVDIKTAYVPGVPTFTVKIASFFPNNAQGGLAGGSGMMVVFSARTGYCEAVLLDNGYLTELRTALAGAVAADLLAPLRIGTVGVLGTGVQARAQVRCLALVRKFDQVVVWGRSRAHAEEYVADMERLGIRVESVDAPEEVVTRSSLVIATTASRAPLIEARWLHSGLHINAVGADFPGKQELEPEVLEKADRLYCDKLDQCIRLGELQHWRGSRPPPAIELGGVVRNASPRRASDQEITVCDLTGVGVQDTAIAAHALALARQKYPDRFAAA